LIVTGPLHRPIVGPFSQLPRIPDLLAFWTLRAHPGPLGQMGQGLRRDHLGIVDLDLDAMPAALDPDLHEVAFTEYR